MILISLISKKRRGWIWGERERERVIKYMVHCILNVNFDIYDSICTLILGGGGLALFGTGNLHTWAKDVEEIYSRFTDNRKIDRTKFMDDSAYR